MTDFEKATLANAINRYGINRQLVKLMEECGELVQAAAKVAYDDGDSGLDRLAEEMADVEVLMDQLRILFPRSIGEAEGRWRERKISRLAGRLEHGG